MSPTNSMSKKSAASAAAANAKKIPRPLNCFLAYRLEKQSEIVARCPGANHRDISKIIAKWWKEATEEEKAPYRERARIAKLEHARLYPDYKYTPQKKTERKTRRYTIRPKNKFTSRSESNNRMMELFYKDRTVLSAANSPVEHNAELLASPLSWPDTPESATSGSFYYPPVRTQPQPQYHAHPPPPPTTVTSSPSCGSSVGSPAHYTNDDVFYTTPMQQPAQPNMMMPMYAPQTAYFHVPTEESIYPSPTEPTKMPQSFIDPNLLSSMMPVQFNHPGNNFYYDDMPLHYF